jgi:ketosteroid isomerase-like protein
MDGKGSPVEASLDDPRSVMERFARGINARDLEAVIACFADDYHDVEPAHPKRQIAGGIEEVRKNWGMLLRAVPDFRSEVSRVAVDGDAAFIEQDWSGTRSDGTKMHLRGVNVFGIHEGKIAWGRVYMEAVEEDGIDLDERVRRMAEGT